MTTRSQIITIASLFFSATITGQVLNGSRSREANPEVQEQIGKLEITLRKSIKSKNFEEAESTIDKLELLGLSKSHLGRYRGEIALRNRDYARAQSELRKYFEGERPGTRYVAGRPTETAWWFFLESRSQNLAAADRAYKHLVATTYVNAPDSMDRLDVTKIRTGRVSQILLLLAAYDLRKGNLLRTKFYLNRAKALDSKLQIPIGFETELKRYKTIRTQEEQIEERVGEFVIFDPLVSITGSAGRWHSKGS